MAVNFTHEPAGEFLAIHNPIIFEFGTGDIATIIIYKQEAAYEIKANNAKQFYFDASELFQSYFNRDFEDPNASLEDTASVFLDGTLSRKVTLTFQIEGDDDTETKTYILLQAAKELGADPLVGQKDLLTLKISDTLPISKGTYQEVSVYSKIAQTVDEKDLVEGVNRIRLNGTEDPNIILANFNIRVVEQVNYYDGIRVKYFSRAGSWVYLRSICNHQVSTEVSTLGRYERIRGNVEAHTSNFTTIGRTGYDLYTLAFTVNDTTKPYIRDLILSPKVYIELMNKWFEAETQTNAITGLSTDTRTTQEISFRLSEIDTLQLS